MKLSTLVILLVLVATSAFAQTPAPAPGQPPLAGSEMHRHDDAPLAPAGVPTGGQPVSPTSFSGLVGVLIGAVLLMVMLAALAYSTERHPPRHA